MFDSVLNTPLELLTIFDVWMGSRYPSDMFKERQKLRKTCKWVIFKNVAAKTKKWFLRNFWENLYWEMIFFTVIFSKFCKKFRSSHQRCSIKKDVLKNFVIFTEKHLCWSPFLIKLQDWRHTTILKRDSNTGVFLLRAPILKNICERLLL